LSVAPALSRGSIDRASTLPDRMNRAFSSPWPVTRCCGAPPSGRSRWDYRST